MTKEELKPIDVSKYTVTESGNVIKGEEKKTTKEDFFRQNFSEYCIGDTFLSPYWDLFEAGYELKQNILSQHILELQADKGRLTDENSVLAQNLEDTEICEKSLKDKVANLKYLLEGRDNEIDELKSQIEKMKWHKLDWNKAEEYPDVDKLVRVKTRGGAEYIGETYSYFPAEDEIGYGSVITQFAELNGDWIDDNEIEYWCYIEPFKEIEEK